MSTEKTETNPSVKDEIEKKAAELANAAIEAAKKVEIENSQKREAALHAYVSQIATRDYVTVDYNSCGKLLGIKGVMCDVTALGLTVRLENELTFIPFTNVVRVRKTIDDKRVKEIKESLMTSV